VIATTILSKTISSVLLLLPWLLQLFKKSLRQMNFFSSVVPKMDLTKLGCVGAKKHVSRFPSSLSLSLCVLIACNMPKGANKDVQLVQQDIQEIVDAFEPEGVS
jgi:predicted small secreted protein